VRDEEKESKGGANADSRVLPVLKWDELKGPLRDCAGEAKWGILASILGHYQAKMAQKRPKKGQKRGFTVTSQLTMRFCMLFII